MKKLLNKWSKIITVILLLVLSVSKVSSQSDKVSKFNFNHVTSCLINSQGNWQDCAEGYRNINIEIDMNSNVIYLNDGNGWSQFAIISSTSDRENVYIESHWEKYNLNVSWQISAKLRSVYCTLNGNGKRILVYSDR
jgi:hypothetical protein